MDAHENAAICILSLGAVQRKYPIITKLFISQFVVARATDIIEDILVSAVELIRFESKLSSGLYKLPQRTEHRTAKNRMTRRVCRERRGNVISLIGISYLRTDR